MPPPGDIDAWPIWYRLMDLASAFVSVSAPICAVARLASVRRRPKIPAIDTASADVSY